MQMNEGHDIEAEVSRHAGLSNIRTSFVAQKTDGSDDNHTL
jgi:hypothetical protein